MEATNKIIYKENIFKKIRSKYILRKIFSNLKENKLLQIIKYNKNIQKRLNKHINDYIKYNQIEIEIFPINKDDKNYFINIQKENELYYHIYFNDEKKKKKKLYK